MAPAFSGEAVAGAATTVERLLGEYVTSQDEVRLCHDIQPIPLSEEPLSRRQIARTLVSYRAAESVASCSLFRTLPLPRLLIRGSPCTEVPDLIVT